MSDSLASASDAASPLSSWSVTFDASQSTITSVSHGTTDFTTGVVHLTPDAATKPIAAGATRTGAGFCANRNAAGATPMVYEATGTP
ncbi:MAG TPA: hypothetical protein VER96_05235 [Polyangiaceae bacterium]|nr:hypothetical protein [Polyangiaceae bacterium]